MVDALESLQRSQSERFHSTTGPEDVEFRARWVNFTKAVSFEDVSNQFGFIFNEFKGQTMFLSDLLGFATSLVNNFGTELN